MARWCRRASCTLRRNRRRALKDARQLHGDGHQRAAGGHPGQGHRRRGVCAGHAAARHAARSRGAAAASGRPAGGAGYRRCRDSCPAWSGWCATAASSPWRRSGNSRRSRRCARWPPPRNGRRRHADPAAAGRHLRPPHPVAGAGHHRAGHARHAIRRGEDADRALYAALSDARFDRPVLRRRATAGRHDDGLDAYPGRVSGPPRHRRDAEPAGRAGALHPCRGRRLLWP